MFIIIICISFAIGSLVGHYGGKKLNFFKDNTWGSYLYLLICSIGLFIFALPILITVFLDPSAIFSPEKMGTSCGQLLPITFFICLGFLIFYRYSLLSRSSSNVKNDDFNSNK